MPAQSRAHQAARRPQLGIRRQGNLPQLKTQPSRASPPGVPPLPARRRRRRSRRRRAIQMRAERRRKCGVGASRDLLPPSNLDQALLFSNPSFPLNALLSACIYDGYIQSKRMSNRGCLLLHQQGRRAGHLARVQLLADRASAGDGTKQSQHGNWETLGYKRPIPKPILVFVIERRVVVPSSVLVAGQGTQVGGGDVVEPGRGLQGWRGTGLVWQHTALDFG